NALGITKSGRSAYFSTESNKIDEPLKVEEAETLNVPPPPADKLLVLGGSGFVGSHICKEAINRGLNVASISRIQVDVCLMVEYNISNSQVKE
ncbi:NAD(P)-binding domain-containing protein, partial [Tanacetum coccineum]